MKSFPPAPENRLVPLLGDAWKWSSPCAPDTTLSQAPKNRSRRSMFVSRVPVDATLTTPGVLSRTSEKPTLVWPRWLPRRPSRGRRRPSPAERIYVEPEAYPFGEWQQARDGKVQVPQGPGLGVEPDLEVIERYRHR